MRPLILRPLFLRPLLEIRLLRIRTLVGIWLLSIRTLLLRRIRGRLLRIPLLLIRLLTGCIRLLLTLSVGRRSGLLLLSRLSLRSSHGAPGGSPLSTTMPLLCRGRLHGEHARQRAEHRNRGKEPPDWKLKHHDWQQVGAEREVRKLGRIPQLYVGSNVE